MKASYATFFFLPLLLSVTFSSSCEKEDIADNRDKEVTADIISPSNGQLCKVGDSLSIKAQLLAGPGRAGVEGVSYMYRELMYEADYEVGYAGPYLEPNASLILVKRIPSWFEKGWAALSVCHIRIIEERPGYPAHRELWGCDDVILWFQDEVGMDLQVRIEGNSTNGSQDSISLQRSFQYEYEITAGDTGTFMIDVLNADRQVIETLLETELAHSDTGEVTSVFPQSGVYYFRARAMQFDSTSENTWLTRVEVF